MTHVFLYGTLRHSGLLEIVLGHVPHDRLKPARLEGFHVARAKGHEFPLIVERAGTACEGLLLHDVTPQERARLDHYELGFGYRLRAVDVQGEEALVYFPDEGLWEPAEPWSLQEWRTEHWPYVRFAAGEIMSLMGQVDAAEVARRFATINQRAHAQALARGAPQPTDRRSALHREDVALRRKTPSHFGFFRTDTLKLSHPLFGGTDSADIEREVFLTGDAALVLPYDPERDRVLLIEQFRMGPYGRGDLYPWTLEPIAGRIDPGEEPAAAARRECFEEARIELDELLPVANYYPSPGEVSSFFHTFVALADLPETGQGHGGLESENEDIRTHVLSFCDSEALMRSGEINVGPLLHLLLWLKAERQELRRR
ncbi:NUDIX domain-containing protein [Rhodobacteraceae bacterium 63075]|nr:NUDIX domain-containing protein [Rhodobacteraceae bacterium 63075]